MDLELSCASPAPKPCPTSFLAVARKLPGRPPPTLSPSARYVIRKKQKKRRGVLTLKGLLSPVASTNGLTSKSDMAAGRGSANSAVTPAGLVVRRSVANFLDFEKFSAHARRSLPVKGVQLTDFGDAERSGGRRQVSTV